MFLDKTYFYGEIYLPGLERSYSEPVGLSTITQTVGENDIEWYIKKYEKEYILDLLGKDLGEAYISGIMVRMDDPKWTFIKNLIYVTDGKDKYSPAANYVYYWIQLNGISNTTTKSEVRGSVTNGTPYSPVEKMVKAYNDCVEESVKIAREICKHWDEYGYSEFSKKRCLFLNRSRHCHRTHRRIPDTNLKLINSFGI